MAKTNKINIVEQGPQQRISYVKSPEDIDWAHPLHEQLWPNLSGCPTPGKSEAEFRLLRKQIPMLTEEQFHNLFPNYQASSIEVVNPTTDARRYVELREVAAWILSGVHWFEILEQPMMLAIWAKNCKMLRSSSACCRYSRSHPKTTFQSGKSLSKRMTTLQ